MWRSVAGGGALSTCSDALPATPFGAVAVIVASPAAWPDANPVCVTDATPVGFVDHVNDVPAIGLFEASNAVAVYCCVPPTVTVALAGKTTTLATGTGGVTSPS